MGGQDPEAVALPVLAGSVDASQAMANSTGHETLTEHGEAQTEESAIVDSQSFASES